MILYKCEGEIHLIKKGLAIGIIFLFVAMIWAPSTGMIVGTRSSLQYPVGTILYVGGAGSNNYTTIQDAITHSTNGDTVFVYDDSSPYFEHIVVNKSIHLIGENRNTTLIDGGNVGDVVILSFDNITICGFTIQHSGDTSMVNAGIKSLSKRNVISNNSIIQNGRYAVGIFLNGSSDNLVTDNFISENGNEGIFLETSNDNIVRDNVITMNGHCAIVISKSSGNTIVENDMHDNYATVSLWPGSTENEIAWNTMCNQEFSGVGIWPGANQNDIHHNYLYNNSLYGFIITRAQGNVIANNTILGSNEGMHLNMANFTTIKFNNFINNNYSAFFENSSFNRWKRNYWDDHHGIWPKCIKGTMRLPWNKTIVIRWINFDWFPSQRPYDIPLLEKVK
jgi:parallel beta-helix repeat protein